MHCGSIELQNKPRREICGVYFFPAAHTYFRNDAHHFYLPLNICQCEVIDSKTMAPDRNPKRTLKKKLSTNRGEIEKRVRASSDDHHEIVFFQRHILDDINESTPGQDFLNEICPEGVRRTFRAVLIAVAKAPPKRFAGGGYWEAMHGEMSGWYEVRVNGPKRRHYRLFCLCRKLIGERKYRSNLFSFLFRQLL